jgi:hypothetical protein
VILEAGEASGFVGSASEELRIDMVPHLPGVWRDKIASGEAMESCMLAPRRRNRMGDGPVFVREWVQMLAERGISLELMRWR